MDVHHLVSSQRKSLARPNQVREPAHPVVADALCAAGRNLADTAEPIWLHLIAHRTFWTLLAIACPAILWARSEGLLP